MYAIVVENEKELLELAEKKGLKIIQLEENHVVNSADTEKKHPKFSCVSEFLLFIGIRPHIKGFHYLMYAFENDIDCIDGGITTVLYPTVAKKFNTTSSRVERAIRHAIETVKYDTQTIELYESIFGHFKNKPTNSQFVEGCKVYLEKNLIR